MLANLTMITQSLFFPTVPSFSDTLLKTTADALGKWKDLVRNYTKTVDEEVYDSVYYWLNTLNHKCVRFAEISNIIPA